MTAVPAPGSRPGPGPHRHPGDGWVQCRCGSRHWGLHGAAGLLLARRGRDGRVDAVVLQHRALWSDQGGTWGVPGGAIGPHESPEQGALREAAEEAGIPLAAVRLLDSVVLDHGTWRYTTVVAEALSRFEPAATDAESLEVRWVPADDVARLPLLPAFADAWPRLRTMLDTGGLDTAVPDTAVPDTAVPDTAVPDTAVPDTAVPDTATEPEDPCT